MSINTAASIYQGHIQASVPCSRAAALTGIIQTDGDGGSGSPAGDVQRDSLTIGTNGQTVFSITQIPNDVPAMEVYYNGYVLLRNGTNYSISSTTLTLLSVDWAIEAGDTLDIIYSHD